jgi:hypothetical protein
MANNNGKLARLSRFFTRHRLAVLLAAVAVAIAFGFGISKIRGEVILQELLPYDHPYLKLHARFSEVFGTGGSGVVIALRAREGDIFNESMLHKIRTMTNTVVLWDGTYRTLTLSIARRTAKVVKTLGQGVIRIDPLMWPEVPADEREMALLKKHIFTDPAYNGILVSRDRSAMLLLTEFKENVSYEQVFHKLRGLTEEYTDEESVVHIVGFPMLMGWIYSYKPQIIFVSVVSVGLMLVVMFMIFRNISGLIPPVSFGIICTAMGLGFIGWMGINFSPLLYVLAFLVGARMVSHSVQITHRYFEEYAGGGRDNIAACEQTMTAMLVPNWAGVATDAAGFFVLIFAKIVLMQQVAVFMSFWMLCIGLCGILTPILCSYMPMKKAAEQYTREQEDMSLLDRVCTAATRFSIRSGKWVVAGACVVLFAFCLYEAGHLKIGDPTPGTPLLWPEHTYNRDQAFIDATFDASSENFMLFYEGKQESVYDPVVLRTFEAFSRHMQRELPDIYKSSSSLINLVKNVNVMLHDGDSLWYQLPVKERMLTGFMGFIRDRVDPASLGRFVDRTMERAQITVYFADHTSKNLLRIKEAALNFFDHHPQVIDTGEFKLAGGRIGMEIAVNEEMKRSHLFIDLMVLAVIFILCSIAFSSFVCGLMLTVPLILANLVAFAYMSLNNIGLSINTLPVAAVGVGVGVDFAIYIYSRCIDEFSRQDGWESTIMTAVRTSGKAVVYTGLTMILPIMTWYYISDLKFQAQMGVFLSMIIGANVIFAVTLHPLLIYVIKPAFIVKKGRANAESSAAA